MNATDSITTASRRPPTLDPASTAPMPDDMLRWAGQQPHAHCHFGDEVEATLHLLYRVASLKDGTTGRHIARMAQIATALGAQWGLSIAQQDLLMHAAPLHDIGKIAIPDAILRKPGPLTDDELTVMRTHATRGHELLAPERAPVLRLGAEIARNHHERWDGGGYPNGLAGTQIPLSARIVAVADVLDALVSTRPYKPAWSYDQAVAHIERNAGAHFDPGIVACIGPATTGIQQVLRALGD